VLLLSVVLVVLSAGVSSQQRPVPRPQQQAQANQEEQAPSQPPTIHVTVQGPEPSPEMAEQDRQARQRELGIQETIAGYTKALVFVGVAQVFAAIIGFIVSIRAANAARDGAEAARMSASAAEINATAAADSARTAKNNMFLSLRARMNVDKLVVRDLEVNKAPQIMVAFKNFGGKGAYAESYHVIVAVTPALPSTPPVPPDDSPKWDIIGCPTEAGQVHSVEIWTEPLSVADYDDIQSGAKSYFIWGVLRYNDGFGAEKRVGFARVYEVAASRARKNPVFSTIGGRAYNYAT
jgi:hypothetical protein